MYSSEDRYDRRFFFSYLERRAIVDTTVGPGQLWVVLPHGSRCGVVRSGTHSRRPMELGLFGWSFRLARLSNLSRESTLQAALHCWGGFDWVVFRTIVESFVNFRGFVCVRLVAFDSQIDVQGMPTTRCVVI